MSETILAAEYRARTKKKPSKYRNVKTTIGTEKFDSKREALRHLVLKQMERDDKIHALARQPKFDLYVKDKKICRYVGDWLYRAGPAREHNAPLVVEDAKGVQTRDFKIKWSLCKALYPDITWKLS